MSGKRMNILLIEDNNQDKVLIERMLSSFEDICFDFTSVETLEQGLKALSENKFDVLLLDLGLPDSSQENTLEWMSSQKMPIVIVTSNDDKDFIMNALKGGAQDYLIKSKFNKDLLKRCLFYAYERWQGNNQVVNDLLSSVEARYKSLFENISVGLYRNTPGPEGKFIVANQSLVEMMGCSSLDEVLDVTVADMYVDKAQRAVLSSKIVESGEIIGEEIHLKKKNGDLMWGSITAKAVRNDQGEIIYFDGMIEDITEKKEFQNLLLEREVLLNEVGDIAKIGGWEMDLKNGGNAKWTKGTYDILSIGYDEPIPGYKDHVSWYLPEYREMIESKMAGLVSTKEPMHFEAQVKTNNGDVKWCQAYGRVCEEGGEVVKLIGTFQDITKRKKNEEEIRNSLFNLNESRNLLTHVINLLPMRIFWKDKELNYLGCNKLFASEISIWESLLY